jgi:translocation and assembly module TamA
LRAARERQTASGVWLGMRASVFLHLALATLASVTLAPPARAEIRYETEIELKDLKDKTLSQSLKDASQLVALEDRPPPSDAALRRRVEDDLPRLNEVMQAAGYWLAKLSYAIEAEGEKATVKVAVDPGPLFQLASVDFRTPEGGPLPDLEKLGLGSFGLAIDGPARSQPIVAAEQRIVEEYGRTARPFAKVTDRKAVIDIATHTMRVTYTVEPGIAAKFGPLDITGLARVDRDFVARRIAWKEGEPYDVRAVETTRQDLVKTSLFSAVRISHADAPDEKGEVAMTLALTEGPPRSVGAGIAYNTNLGLGAQVFWEHRNLFGSGENLRVTAGAAERQLALALAFRKPDFIERNQDLLANAGLLQQKTDAYNARREQIFLGIERPLLPSLTMDGGLDFEHANVSHSIIGSEDYSLVGLPFLLRHDTTDDLLDPTIGSRQTLTLIPYHSISGPSLNFLTSRIELRHYQRLDDTGRILIAGFGALGSIVGASRDAVPPDKRLYAGGAGSVRGYAYQHAGPINDAGIPVGGISSLELGAEFRYRITDTIGIAPFIEGGNVYPTSLPNSASLFWGAGIGVRYYTVVGPVRLDLATPFTHRPGDKPIEVYVSIGQAF